LAFNPSLRDHKAVNDRFWPESAAETFLCKVR
jgi:hypothetical protein